MYQHPQFGSTVTLDCAGERPLVIVRGGQPNEEQASLGYSMDGGHSWKPLSIPSNLRRQRRNERPAITVSADGNTFMVVTRTPLITRDRGENLDSG